MSLSYIYSYNNVKNNKKEVSLRTSKLSFKKEQEENQNKANYSTLERKMDSITKSCSKLYFKDL
jgi:hypothetical protein